MTITTATSIATIVVDAVIAFTEGVQVKRGMVVAHGLTHLNDGFVHDYPANVPCLIVRDEWTGRNHYVRASQLVHVYAPGEEILGSGFAA